MDIWESLKKVKKENNNFKYQIFFMMGEFKSDQLFVE